MFFYFFVGFALAVALLSAAPLLRFSAVLLLLKEGGVLLHHLQRLSLPHQLILYTIQI
jgi:hypothetical protein